MTDTAWRFRPSPIDGGRTGGDQAAMNFEHDLETFVREVLQNSLDARRGDSPTITVEVAIHQLAGATKTAFLEAAHWHDLRRHAAAARTLAPALTAAIPRLDAPDTPILAVAIHDGPALGLSGPERGEGRFASFVRNKLISDKESGSAGGSYGLGKSVLWAFSGISTVFVHSEPLRTTAADPSSRFIGVAQLPWHQLDGQEFDGPGWFGAGEISGTIAWSTSFPPAPQTLEALHLTRPSALQTGTSIVVPDFQTDLEPRALADELARAAAKWFWPAMVGSEKSLEVWVRLGQHRRRVDPTEHQELRAFLHLAGLAPHAVWTPRTVTGTEPLQLPGVQEIMKGTKGFDFHGPQEASDAFRLEALALEDGLGDLDKHMALIRGARMVVRYVKLQSDRPAWAIARAGTACSEGASDRRVEQFLRHAEPPSHDDWSPHAPKLHDRYKKGYVGELKGLKKRLADKVLTLLRRQEGNQASQEIPAVLRKVLAVSLGSSAGDNPREGRFDYRIESCELETTDRGAQWRFGGWLQNTREGKWELQVEAWLDSDGEKVHVGVERLHVEAEFATPSEKGICVEGTGHMRFSGVAPLRELGSQARRAVFGIHLRQVAARTPVEAREEARA